MTDRVTTATHTNGNGHAPDQWKDDLAALNVADTVKAVMLKAGVAEQRRLLKELPPEEREPVFKRYSLREFIKRPAKEWLVNGLIAKGEMAMIFGEAGSGKTFVTIDMIYSAITARMFANQFSIPRPLVVAYCAGEGVSGLPGRFTAAGNHYQVWDTEAENNLHLFTSVPQLFEADIDTTIYRFVDEWKADNLGPLDLLVLDTLHSSTFGADENHSKDVGIIKRATQYAIAELGCTVLFDHHANRAGGYRGSSAFHGDMDSMIQTRPNGEIFSLEYFKLKDGERFNPLFFKLRPEHEGQSVYVEWLDAATVQLEPETPTKKEQAKKEIIALLQSKPGLNQTQIVETLTAAGRKTILAALKELQDSGMVEVGEGPNRSKIYQLRLVVP